jgi:hypothetical protein
MIVTAPVGLDEELLVPRDQPPKQALDDPHPLDALASFTDERRMTARQAQQLEQFGAAERLEREERVGLFPLGCQRRRAGRSERVVRRLLGRRVLVMRVRGIVTPTAAVMMMMMRMVPVPLSLRIGRMRRRSGVVARRTARRTAVVDVGAIAIRVVVAVRVFVRARAGRVRRVGTVAAAGGRVGAATAGAIRVLTPLRMQEPQCVFGIADQKVGSPNDDCVRRAVRSASQCLLDREREN